MTKAPAAIVRQISGIRRRDTFRAVVHQCVSIDFLLKDRLAEVGRKAQTKAEIVTLSLAELFLQSIPAQGLNFINQIDAQPDGLAALFARPTL